MCGRFSLALEAKLLRELLGVGQAAPNLDAWRPSWNIAPSQLAPSFSHRGAGGLALRSWGASLGGRFVFNVRAETLANSESPLMRRPPSRCLIPADAFYEWKGSGRTSVPYLFKLPEEPLMLLAGVLLPVPGEPFAIVTCEAREPLASIHARSPAPLSGSAASLWLDSATGFASACEALRERECAFEMRQVDRRVGSSSFNGPEAWREAAAPEEMKLL